MKNIHIKKKKNEFDLRHDEMVPSGFQKLKKGYIK
jgi:hypothetical protein